MVAQIRQRWTDVEIWIRGDSGFAREALMAWCEANDVAYVLGLARNARLARAIGHALHEVEVEHATTQVAARRFVELRYRTARTLEPGAARGRARRSRLPGKQNPRFVVTSLGADRFAAQALYEQIYCARGDMENRIKEQQLDLFAGRAPARIR